MSNFEDLYNRDKIEVELFRKYLKGSIKTDELGQYCSITAGELTSLVGKIISQEQESKDLIECVEFYAETERWDEAYCSDEAFYLVGDHESGVGGKRARKCLEKINTIE